MRQVYHHYAGWEDWKAGMYKKNRGTWRVRAAQDLLSSGEQCLKAMKSVVAKWPIATEHNLTNNAQNRRAWMGWAACCLVHGANRYATCEAWALLSEQERDIANACADTVIHQWETRRRSCQKGHLGSLF